MAARTKGMSRADFDRLNEKIPGEYPTNIGAAVDELRQRGYDGRADTLNYLIRKGAVDEAKEGPRSQPSWTKKRIDQAAKWLDQNDFLSPIGWVWHTLDIDPLQYRQAENDARDKYGNPDAVAMVIFPGSPRRVAFVSPENVKEQ